MSRIFREMEVNGVRYWTLFDSGARGSYVTRSVSEHLPGGTLRKSVERRLGGYTFSIDRVCTLIGSVEDYEISTVAMVVDHLFPDEHGRGIEIIIGAEAMELWGIGMDMANRRLDFTHYAREATEG